MLLTLLFWAVHFLANVSGAQGHITGTLAILKGGPAVLGRE